MISAVDLYNEFEKLVEKGLARKTVDKYEEWEIISFCYGFTTSYTDFVENPYLIECRGTSFIKDKDGNISIFTRLFEKFFNYLENPFTSEEVINKLTPVSITEKLDGSLIGIGQLPNGKLLAKTKSTINSDQAKRVTQIINNDESYREFCEHQISHGYTPMFEYTSPTNQVVLFYPEEKLTLIALRSIESGEYFRLPAGEEIRYLTGNLTMVDGELVVKDGFELRSIPVVEQYNMSIEVFIKLQGTSKNEGYVVEFNNGLRVKFKTLDYCMRHRAKESIYNLKNLTEIILEDKVDDIMPLIFNDEASIAYVNNIKDNILNIYKTIDERVNRFYNTYKGYERKYYAIEAQKENSDILGLLMNKYLGKDVNIKEHIMKRELYKNLEEE